MPQRRPRSREAALSGPHGLSRGKRALSVVSAIGTFWGGVAIDVCEVDRMDSVPLDLARVLAGLGVDSRLGLDFHLEVAAHDVAVKWRRHERFEGLAFFS